MGGLPGRWGLSVAARGWVVARAGAGGRPPAPAPLRGPRARRCWFQPCALPPPSLPLAHLAQLYVYDLSRGLARQFSPMLLGKQVRPAEPWEGGGGAACIPWGQAPCMGSRELSAERGALPEANPVGARNWAAKAVRPARALLPNQGKRSLAQQRCPHAAVCRPAPRLQIEGIWHSSVVVGGTEIYFGFGISMAVPGTTPFGQPTHIYDLGWA